MFCMDVARNLILPALLVAASAAAQQTQTSGIDSTGKLLGISSEIEELRTLCARNAEQDRWRILSLHQDIAEKVMAASLDVDATIAQIENEIARADEVHSYLSDRRDRRVNRDNLLSVILGGGLGATSSGLQLSSSLTQPGAAVGIAAGTISASLAVAGIRAQKGERTKFDFQSNMLAEFFDRPLLPDSHYSEMIWEFLNEPPANTPAAPTRKQQLLKTWIQVKRIETLASAGKIERLTSQPSEQVKLSIDDFEDRAAMLQDVSARISFLKRDLARLLSSLPPLASAKRLSEQ